VRTIRDVAAHAGVSVATVSRWLSGQNVHAADAVRRAVEELDYRPNVSARSLRTGHRGVIGVIVPDITNPFFASIVKGLEQALPRGTYRMLLASSNESAELEAAIVADLAGRVDGFILVPAVESDTAPAELLNAGVPAVLLDREVTGSELHDVVLVDNRKGARTAAEHLIGLGHRRIAAIQGPNDTTPGRERRVGFCDALQKAGIAIDPELDRSGDFREMSGRQLATELMQLPDPPTAIFSANNLMTIGVLKALRDLRIAIPDDVSVIGFDDIILGSLLHPPLTCITRPVEEQGSTSMRMLLQRVTEANHRPPGRVVMDTHLELRASTAPPRDSTAASERH
jgi:LacI family transcriptional regulator